MHILNYVIQKLDLQLEAQRNIYDKDNTYGNAMWTPEQQKQHEQMMQQKENNGLDEIEEIPDNIRYYNPDARGFTEAEYQK